MDIRLILVELASALLGAIPDDVEQSTHIHLRWSKYALLLLESTTHDADIALKIATETSSHRQVVKCQTFIQRSRFATFQFNFQMSCRQGLASERREEFKLSLEQSLASFESETASVRAQYLRQVQGTYTNKLEWILENYDPSISQIASSWDTIKRAVSDGVFYAEVSTKEKMSIVKALNFG